jgi:hypothetical protein
MLKQLFASWAGRRKNNPTVSQFGEHGDLESFVQDY